MSGAHEYWYDLAEAEELARREELTVAAQAVLVDLQERRVKLRRITAARRRKPRLKAKKRKRAA